MAELAFEHPFEVVVDPVEAAGAAGLTYVEDGEPGYSRRRRGRGFVYFDPAGERVTEPELRRRFEKLVIPPAWTDVWICPDPAGHILATGRDAKGRKQYLYHPGWDAQRNLTKFSRMISFGEALPGLRARVEADLRRRALDHPKVVGLVVRLLEETMIRVGNPEYARRNASFGLTTLLDDHIQVRGGRVRFNFRGKSGKQHEIDLQNRRLARLVKGVQELPGQRLFQYVHADGSCCQTVTSGDVNAYLRETTGQDFSAKDFRTWCGTILAAVTLYERGPAENEKQANKQIVAVVKEVSRALGNTPATARKYYIHPGVLAAYLDDSLFQAMTDALQEAAAQGAAGDEDGLISPEEQGVLGLLRRSREAGLDRAPAGVEEGVE